MRYGQPSIASRMEHLQKEGCERILVFPLYPQYAAATTATVNDKAFEALLKMRWQPAVCAPCRPTTTIPPISRRWRVRSRPTLPASTGSRTSCSPPSTAFRKAYFDKGDPYYCQCQKTARLLRDRLGWSKEKLQVTFQSRFGPEEWLQPYTDKTVEKLAQEGVKRIAVINPGFVSDCLETLEEIAGEAAESFHHNGGEKFTHIPCLNDSPEGMAVLETVVRRELAGWI